MQLTSNEIALFGDILGTDTLKLLLDNGAGGYVERDYSRFKTLELHSAMKGTILAITLAIGDIQTLALRTSDIAKEIGNRSGTVQPHGRGSGLNTKQCAGRIRKRIGEHASKQDTI